MQSLIHAIFSVSLSTTGSFSIGHIAATSSGLLPGNVSFFNKTAEKCASRKPERNLREAIDNYTNFRLKNGEVLLFSLRSPLTNSIPCGTWALRWCVDILFSSRYVLNFPLQQSKSAKSSREKKKKTRSIKWAEKDPTHVDVYVFVINIQYLLSEHVGFGFRPFFF